ncbi:tetraspanin Tsp3 [Ophiocordyceps camponoti-floridani]|uniref:Tetraspanin Tsp3 n=1 Tax=Ophiocordyceps camponoti-floridani TaxID=2030778 RepID=A0A8H4VDY4_9HYPO|nr:tetraspanin Tsp3 [Ophiocordyceps camponoti-floridani]
MSIWLIVHLALVLLLVGVAIYEHVNSVALSLPIRSSLTIITIILPLLAALNAIFYQRLLRTASAAAQRRTLPRVLTLQALQAILITVLATLFFSEMVPSTAGSCLLSTIWQDLFSDHDADSIRRIQDGLNCCGFNTVQDRPWPFPDHQTARECADTYRRDVACSRPWQSALQRNSGVEFGVILVVGLWQIASLILPLRKTLQKRDARDVERARLLTDATEAEDGCASRRAIDGNDAADDAGPGPESQPSRSLLEL